MPSLSMLVKQALAWCCTLAMARPAQLLQRCENKALTSGNEKELRTTVCRKARAYVQTMGFAAELQVFLNFGVNNQ